jgi:hypothetical protein
MRKDSRGARRRIAADAVLRNAQKYDQRSIGRRISARSWGRVDWPAEPADGRRALLLRVFASFAAFAFPLYRRKLPSCPDAGTRGAMREDSPGAPRRSLADARTP